jgi:hypothetical protein
VPARGAVVATKTLEIKGGQKLTAKLAELSREIGSGGVVNVGFLEGASYPAGSENAGLPVAQVAFWNEFGTVNAPTRPFFRGMIAQNSPEWGEQLGANIKLAGYNSQRALELQGTVMKDQLVKSIVDTTSPPNAPSTIARKGFDKPLIDTGYMQRSADFVVKTA